MQQLEAVSSHHFVHPHRERKIVWRKLEERVSADVDLVEENAGKERRQAKWLAIRDEMHFVSAIGEGDTELRRDRARAAVGRVARDANLH
jgi:hypothetical protein